METDVLEFCVCDLWAAEAYITALESGEKKYLELLAQGYKIHNWCWDRINERFPVELKAARFGYKNAKQFVHATNYGANPKKLQQVSGLPYHVDEWFWNFYHTTFPAIKTRQRTVERELVAQGKLVTSLGRHRIFFMPFSNELLNVAYAWRPQSTIGEITNIALAKLYWLGRRKRGPYLIPALNNHDGLACESKRAEREQVKLLVRDAFNIPITFNGMTITVPIEIGFGPNFNDIEDKEIFRYDQPSQVS